MNCSLACGQAVGRLALSWIGLVADVVERTAHRDDHHVSVRAPAHVAVDLMAGDVPTGEHLLGMTDIEQLLF
jgi:hypothetical protein